MNRDPDERPQPDGAAPDEFDAIVSVWRREGQVPEWPDEADHDGESFKATPAAPTPAPAERPPDPAPVDPAPVDPAPVDPAPVDPAPVHPAPVDPAAVGPAPVDPAPVDPAPVDPAPVDDEHFVPPEPPPLPRLGPPAFVGLGLIALGLVLLVVPGWIVAEPYGLPLGLVCLASGLGWLVLRLWPGPDSRSDEDDDDDGAVI
ncbi:hypothetical protein GCM10009609_57310 [Pseudonocardia aurantiaca]|uniref:DUF308 domain-containing protein n=1 Tax=Pseudonocardia aurantiaca TaxID=75290 RepID=A0ABW4FFE4_9PSEU